MSVIDNFSGMLEKVNEGFIRSNIHMVSNSLLAKALFEVKPDLQEKVIRNMSIDGAEEVKHLLEQGGITLEIADSARQEIMSMAGGYI
ncbi:MAG: hypothetical protein FWG77_06105 [Treponema sp.]|nr:hypothetical protein [Treponema sp.]